MDMNRWGVEWHSVSKLDGDRKYILWLAGKPLFFLTRKEAREWIKLNYDFIAKRPDLQSEPHGWKMPRAVKVEVIVRKI
jgi:hypothetical protein